jgi:hypothetical protein
LRRAEGNHPKLFHDCLACIRQSAVPNIAPLMKTKRRFGQFFLSVVVCAAACIGTCTTSAQTAQPAVPGPPPVLPDGSSTAAVVFPNGQSITMVSRLNLFPLVGAAAGDTLNVQLRLPPAFAALVMTAQALDGGIVSASAANLTVAADGTASLQFQTGNQPGLYRVLLYLNPVLVTLRFWVLDPSSFNPPTL